MKCMSVTGKRNSSKRPTVHEVSALMVACCALMIVILSFELCDLHNDLRVMKAENNVLSNKLSDCVSEYSILEERVACLETSPSPAVSVPADTEKPETKAAASTPTPAAAVTPAAVPVAATPAATEDPEVTLFNSSSERDYVEHVVMQESGNQPLEGQMAVAQCIRDTAVDRGMSAYAVVREKNQYAPPYKYAVNDSVKEACARVFDNGESVSSYDIRYFYSTVGGYRSNFHETRYTYVMTIKDHRFFM